MLPGAVRAVHLDASCALTLVVAAVAPAAAVAVVPAAAAGMKQ